MIHRNVKKFACLLAVFMCLSLCACEREEQPLETVSTVPTREYKPILPAATNPTTDSLNYTPVYVSCFGSTAVLATVPIKEWNREESECAVREISGGGRILCDCEYGPITKVVIAEGLVPRATSNWFRDLVLLESIQGLEYLHIDYVTDMSHMFSGCERLTELNIGQWDVSNVEDMTGMFDDCGALGELPEWYGAS